MEVDVASWLTIRGSVKQNILLGSKKSRDSDANTIDNSTVVNAGVGFKWNKLNLDATISKAVNPGPGSNGNIVADNFLSNASLTYMF